MPGVLLKPKQLDVLGCTRRNRYAVMWLRSVSDGDAPLHDRFRHTSSSIGVAPPYPTLSNQIKLGNLPRSRQASMLHLHPQRFHNQANTLLKSSIARARLPIALKRFTPFVALPRRFNCTMSLHSAACKWLRQLHSMK